MAVKLTKRDKVLLYALALIRICFGFLELGIMPQMSRRADVTAEISALEAEQLPMQAAVMALPGMQAAYAEREAALETALEDFYPYMENHEIGSMFTQLLTQNYNLSITSLSMSDVPVGRAVPVYFAAQIQQESTQDTPASAQGENVPLLTSSVSVSASGARARMQALIDDLFQNYPSLRVTGYTIAQQGEDVRLTINFDLYMRTGE